MPFSERNETINTTKCTTHCVFKAKVSESARDLGAVLNSQLSRSSHVAALCRAGFFHLRQLRPAIR